MAVRPGEGKLHVDPADQGPRYSGRRHVAMIRLAVKPPSPTSQLGRGLLAAAALALAMAARMSLTPWLGERQPLIAAVAAAAVVSLLCGVRWALALVLAAVLWVSSSWLLPSWSPDEPWTARAMSALVLCAAAMAGLAVRREPVVEPQAAVRLTFIERALWVAMGLSLFAPLALLVTVAHFSREAAIAAAKQQAESALRVAAEHVARVLQGKEIVARQIHAAASDAGPPERDGTLPALHRTLAELARGMPHVNSLWIIGADGYPVASSMFRQVPRINYSDREYFTFHQTRMGGTYVSRLLITRSTRELFFDISMRWQADDGRFLGVINVTLKPPYFAEFLRDLTTRSPGLTLTLLREDGFVLARAPGAFSTGDRADEELVSRMRSGADHGNRWGSASKTVASSVALAPIGPYPLYVSASLDTGPLLRQWREQVAGLGALALLASGVLLVALYLAWQRSIQQFNALERIAYESEHRLRAEEQLRQSQKVEALGKLTSGVAHDFNNVLAVLQNHLALLARKHPELVASGGILAMQRAVQSGEHLTRKLLTFSRRRPAALELVDLGRALPALGDLLRMTLGDAIELRVDVAPDTPPIEVDRAELEVAMVNLAANARAAMPGGGQLVVQARPAAVGDQLPSAVQGYAATSRIVVLSVADTGIGMDSATLARAAEAFFTTKPEGEGTGLGLNQVETFCAQSGGGIRIASQAGAGTKVLLFFPAAVAASAPLEQSSASGTAPDEEREGRRAD